MERRDPQTGATTEKDVRRNIIEMVGNVQGVCKGGKFSSHSVPGHCAPHTPREAAPVYVQPRFQRARAGISAPVARRPHGDVTQLTSRLYTIPRARHPESVSDL